MSEGKIIKIRHGDTIELNPGVYDSGNGPEVCLEVESQDDGYRYFYMTEPQCFELFEAICGHLPGLRERIAK